MQSKLTSEQYGAAFEEGFPQTVRVVRRQGADPDLAEEIAQEAWGIKGWQRLEQLEDPSRVVAWVNTIASRLFLDYLPMSRRMVDLSAASVEPKISPTVNIAAIDLRRALTRHCSDSQRELIETVHLREDRTVAEIATELNTSVGAIHHRLSRGRHALRRALDGK